MAEKTAIPSQGKFKAEPEYSQAPRYDLEPDVKSKAEKDGIPLRYAKQYDWASGVLSKASAPVGSKDYPGRIEVARAVNEMTRIHILKSEKLGYELSGLADDEQEIRSFFEREKGVLFGESQFMKPEEDYSLTNFLGRVSQHTRVIPLQDADVEMFISPFTKDDFDPSTLSDQELLSLSRVKVPVSDVHFVPLSFGINAEGSLTPQRGVPQKHRPTREEAMRYEVKELGVEQRPLLEMLSPVNYEKALQEAERRAGATRAEYAANAAASGAIPFQAFGAAKPTSKQEFFMEMLDPNFKTVETLSALPGLVAGGAIIGSKAMGLAADRGWKARNAILAGAAGEGLLGVGYQHAAPGMLASYMDKPDDSFLNFAESATIAGAVGLTFAGVSKLVGRRAGEFKKEVEAIGKATTKEEVESIRRSMILRLSDEPDNVPTTVRDGKIINVITGDNPAKEPSFFTRWLSSDAGVDAGIAQRVRQKDSQIAARVNVEMKSDVQQLQRVVEAAGGADDGMLKAINEGIRSGNGIGNLPESVGVAVKNLYERKKAMSGALRNYVPEGMKAVFDKNMDLYLHRSYMIHDDPAYAKKLFTESGAADITNPLVRDAMGWFAKEGRSMEEARIITKAVNEGKPVPTGAELEALIDAGVKNNATDEKLLGQVEALLVRHSEGSFKGAMESADDVLKRRKLDPIKDKPIMRLLGEHTDPYINYSKTVSKMATLMEQIKFSDDIYEAGKGKWVHNDPLPGHAHLIPSTARFGGMAGKYTTKHIHDIMTEVDNLPKMGSVGRLFAGLNAAVNWTKVVPSHVAQFRNLQGGIIMNMAAGRVTPEGGGQAVYDFWNSISGMKNADSTVRLKKYSELGLMDESIDIGYINEFIKDQQGGHFLKTVFGTDPEAIGRQLTGLEALGKASVGKLNEVYQGVDNMMRVFGYEQEIASLKKAFPNLDQAEKMPAGFWPDNVGGTMEEYAARITTNTYPTYSRIPDAVVAWRRIGVLGNFMSFQSEMIRTSKNIVKQGWQEINSGNPTLQAQGAKRLASFIGVGLVGPKAAESTGNALSGTSSDRVNSVRSFLPPWAKNSRIIVLNDNPDKFTYVDVGYTHPHTFLHEPLLHFAVTGDLPESKWTDSLAKMFSPFTDERILLHHGINALRGEDDYGRPVKWHDALLKAFEPGEAATLKRLWESHQEGVRGRDKDAELMNNVFAIRPTTIQMTGNKGALEYKAKDYHRAKGAAVREFSSVITGRVPASPEEQIDSYKKMNKEAFKAQQILYSQIRAAEEWGVEPKKVRNSMVTLGGIPEVMYGRLRQGKFTSVGFSRNMIAREHQDKRATAYREFNKIGLDLNRAALSLEPNSVFPE